MVFMLYTGKVRHLRRIMDNARSMDPAGVILHSMDEPKPYTHKILDAGQRIVAQGRVDFRPIADAHKAMALALAAADEGEPA